MRKLAALAIISLVALLVGCATDANARAHSSYFSRSRVFSGGGSLAGGGYSVRAHPTPFSSAGFAGPGYLNMITPEHHKLGRRASAFNLDGVGARRAAFDKTKTGFMSTGFSNLHYEAIQTKNAKATKKPDLKNAGLQSHNTDFSELSFGKMSLHTLSTSKVGSLSGGLNKSTHSMHVLDTGNKPLFTASHHSTTGGAGGGDSADSKRLKLGSHDEAGSSYAERRKLRMKKLAARGGLNGNDDDDRSMGDEGL